MSYNAKNYTEQGGSVTHIGGKLIIEPDAEVSGLSANPLNKATADTLGGIKVGSNLSIDESGVLSADITPAANQSNSTATTVAALKDDLNELLGKLKTAGLMTADA